MSVSSARARALHAAGSGTARVIVASAVALMPRISRPDRLLAASITLKPGHEIDPQALADLLADAGFTREDPVDQHGEFCVRGGVVDLFPAGEAHPVRLEFVGDTVESIRRYDPATQRSITPLDQIGIVPLRDVFEQTPRRATTGRPPSSDDAGDDAPDAADEPDEDAAVESRRGRPRPRTKRRSAAEP